MPCVHTYARLNYAYQQHHARFKRFVKNCGLPCQACGAQGGRQEIIDREIGGPWTVCGWCEGTGKVTRHLRGLWLREARRAKEKKV